MAGPGLLAPSYETDENGNQIYPAGATPIGEHESGISAGFQIGDWSTYLWYKFTPAHSGVVSIDLYLTAEAGGNQVGVEAYSDTLYSDAPGWRALSASTEWGGPDGNLQRSFGLVTAGVPVIFDVYGYNADDSGVDVAVRISDVLDLGAAPWELGPQVLRDVRHPVNNVAQTLIGVADQGGIPAATLSSVGGVRQSYWTNHVQLSRGAGTPADRDLVGEAIRLARKADYPNKANGYPNFYPSEPTEITEEFQANGSSASSAVSLGWSAQQQAFDPGAYGGRVDAYHNYAGVHLSPQSLSYWAANNLDSDLGQIPAAPDEETLMLPGGFFDSNGATVTDLAFAPDAWDNNTTRTGRGSGATKWLILPAQPTGPAPNRWGPSAVGETQNAVIVANQDGPESTVAEATQVITWNPDHQASWTPVSADLLEHFLSPTRDYEETLLILGMTEAQLVDTNPAPDPWPYDFSTDPLTSWDASYNTVVMHLRLAFARQWRPIPKPTLWAEVTPAINGRLTKTARRFITPS